MGLIGFFRTLLLIVLFYYIFRFIGRVVIPYLLAKGINRMANKYQHKENFTNKRKQEEGKVTIKSTSNNKKKTSPDLGEYVDYEEVN